MLKTQVTRSMLNYFQEAIIALVPRVVELVHGRDIPVIAAGGIVDARGYVAALALGAQGVCLGTRYEHISIWKISKLLVFGHSAILHTL